MTGILSNHRLEELFDSTVACSSCISRFNVCVTGHISDHEFYYAVKFWLIE